MQLLIPAAGRAIGPDRPPPFQIACGRMLIERSIATCAVGGATPRVVVVLDAEQERRFGLRSALTGVVPGCLIVLAAQPTQGALCSALLAADVLDREQPLLVALADVFIDGGIDDAVSSFAASAADVGIITFPDDDRRWSYVRADEAGRVVESAEKRPIGEFATAGIYWYRRAGEFIEAGEAAIRNDRCDNGLYFIAPAINESIAGGRDVRHWPVPRERFFALSHGDDRARFNGR